MIFSALRKLIGRIWAPSSHSRALVTETASASDRKHALQVDGDVGSSQDAPAAYDEALLERSRIQWQFGDWQALAAISCEMLQPHPDRARLALLAAVGHQQLGDTATARNFIDLAQDWGCGKKLIAQVLLAGAHNTLAKAAAAAGQAPRALKHFQASIATGTPNTDLALATHARVGFQMNLMGFIAHPLLSGGTSSGIGFVSEQVAGSSQAAQPSLARQLGQHCLDAEDLHAAVDQVLGDKTVAQAVRFEFLLVIGQALADRKDINSATHFLKMAQPLLDAADPEAQVRWVVLMVGVQRRLEAADELLARAVQGKPVIRLDEVTAAAIAGAHRRSRISEAQKSEHGHDLLIAWLTTQLPLLEPAGRPRVLIEIGSTREDIPGQGSTAKIAAFCKARGLHFVTVDMDAHNTHMAAQLFARLKVPFEAVHMKGEDYLRNRADPIDFVFLDAYDFDHGKHSELRQSRYEKFLGARIADTACHQMHLDCAISVVGKLSPDGAVCVDDTWQEQGLWTAKGTLAMPHLLANGFKLAEARNRAALLTRESTVAA